MPATQNDLIIRLKIVGGASCQIDLAGMVDEGAACSKVTLNGKDLACDSDNGWRWSMPTPSS